MRAQRPHVSACLGLLRYVSLKSFKEALKRLKRGSGVPANEIALRHLPQALQSLKEAVQEALKSLKEAVQEALKSLKRGIKEP